MLRGLLLSLLLCLPPSAPADEAPKASLLYSDLAGYMQRLDALKDLDHLKEDARITSNRPGVKPSDIKLAATLASGRVVGIPIDADGRFTLPSSPELEKQDPLFVSNQPKGSLGLNIKFDIKTPATTADRYRDLMLGATQFNEAIKRQGFVASLLGPKAKGLIIVFDSGDHSLIIHANHGDQVLKSNSLTDARKYLKDLTLTDDSGKATFIYVPLEDDLLDEDPPTSFDVLPSGVIPAL